MTGRACCLSSVAGDTVAMGNLSPELVGPVQTELARAVEQLPGPMACRETPRAGINGKACAGRGRYKQKVGAISNRNSV
jgi:hypothetical protein